MTTLQAVEYLCAPSAFESYRPSNMQNLFASPSQSSLVSPTSSIESLIYRMSKSLLAKIQESSVMVNSQVSDLLLPLENVKAQ